ncbi:DNA/pantothenate metabolism flavoprotein [Mycena sp. CBHHK59/15]|nr:DNA/pantothenate metabolism flavoprotein [Mycena sp. CBHHK59/15]
MNAEPVSFSAESYFATQPAPPSLAQDIAGVQAFVARQVAQNRNVVLVTSGGTTVPLELNVVRFLDNFSAGWLAVIFMHRQFSLQPFSRHYSHSTNPFLDLLAIQDGAVGVQNRADADLLAVLTAYKQVQAAGALHTLTFVTVNDYLWLLRAVSQELSVLRRRAMYYLAAAVSDFFSRARRWCSEHKIQSGKGSLHIEMDQVPKVLKPMVEEWTRDGYIVSFKLETDEHLLIPKARAALERYGHQVVMGMTSTRAKCASCSSSARRSLCPRCPRARRRKQKRKRSTQIPSRSLTFVESWLRIAPTPPAATNQVKEIEEDIVAELVRRHAVWIAGAV